MRSLILATALFFYTIFFNTTAVLAADAASISDATRCSKYSAHKNTCASDSDSQKLVKVTFDSGTADISCAEIKSFIQSACPNLSVGETSKPIDQCRASYSVYEEAMKKRAEKCIKFGDCNSSEYNTCKEAISERDMADSDEKSFESDMKEFLKACPYYAKDEAKATEDRKKELSEQITTKEEKLKKLVEDMKKGADDSAKEHGDLQSDISKMEQDQQEALAKMHEQLGNIQEGSIQQINKIRQTIEEIQYNSKQKNISELGKANVAYAQVMNEIQKQCYEIGRQAAAVEAARLNQRKGVSSRYLMTVAKKNIVEHLRGVANEAYRQCQNKRAFKGPADTAAQSYAAQYKALELENKRANERVAALQKAFRELPEQTQRQLLNTQGQGYAQVNGLSAQIQAKRQQLQQMQANSTQLAMKNQHELGTLQAEQFNDEKSFRAMKAKLVDTQKLVRASTPTQEEFDSARSADINASLAKGPAQNACCEKRADGSLFAINNQTSLCAGWKPESATSGSSSAHTE